MRGVHSPAMPERIGSKNPSPSRRSYHFSGFLEYPRNMTREMPVLDDCSMTCFMFFMPPPWGSDVFMNGLQSTTSVTFRTRPSSNAINSDMGFITEPGSYGSTARLRASP